MTRRMSGLREQETSDGNYLLSREIVPIVQICLRCGVEVGRRGIHDLWHERTDPAPSTTTEGA